MFSSYSEINDSDRRPPDLDFKTGSWLEQIYLSESDVLDILQSLKISKATGPDDISPTLLKNTAGVIYKPLSRLFNKSLSSNTFPDFWKIANVVPIFKKGDSHLCNNYRPVSLLSVPGKFLKNSFSNTCSITSVTIIWYIKCSLVLCRKTVRQTNWYFYTILLLKL